jgi:hypothetical protein
METARQHYHNLSLIRPFETTNHEPIETPFIDFWIENNVLYCRYAKDLHLSLDVAKFCVESRIFFTKGKNYAILVDMRGIKSTTREARHYLATIGATCVKAAALITGSPWNRTLGNIFLTIDKPPVPLKLFTEKEKALEWLTPFIPL